jgi:hypothetical protein
LVPGGFTNRDKRPPFCHGSLHYPGLKREIFPFETLTRNHPLFPCGINNCDKRHPFYHGSLHDPGLKVCLYIKVATLPLHHLATFCPRSAAIVVVVSSSSAAAVILLDRRPPWRPLSSAPRDSPPPPASPNPPTPSPPATPPVRRCRRAPCRPAVLSIVASSCW